MRIRLFAEGLPFFNEMVVPVENCRTLSARECMFDGKRSVTTVTGGGETGWGESIAEMQPIYKFLSGECGAVKNGRLCSQPASCLGGSAEVPFFDV